MIHNQKGFTLIELMVVVLIIGILVAIAIPVFGTAANNARTRSDQANLRTIDGGVAQYQAEFNVIVTDANSGGGAGDAVTRLVTSSFLKQAPVDAHDNSTSYTVDAGGVAHTAAIPGLGLAVNHASYQ